MSIDRNTWLGLFIWHSDVTLPLSKIVQPMYTNDIQSVYWNIFVKRGAD